MGIRARMRALNALLQIRFGPGAAVLPKSIKRINMVFAYDWNNGHLGPRHFWRQCLPRLKYHNPMVAMSVQRTKDTSVKPVMTIVFEDETTKTVDMQMKMSDAILKDFLQVTEAVEVVPSPEEQEELEKLEKGRITSEQDRIRTATVLAKEKEDKALLEQARASIS